MSTSVPKKANKFPLFVHKGRGYWCKTVLGKHHYFGKVADDPQGKEALKLWLWRKDWLLAGLEPPAYDPDGEATISVKHVCNKFMAAKEAKLEAGNLSQRTYEELKEVCAFLMTVIPPGLDAKSLIPEHFENVLLVMQKRYKSPGSRGKRIGIIRSVFKYAYENRLLERPTHFGTEFKKPAAKVYREHRNNAGDKSLSSDEVKALLLLADAREKAMLLLGLQAGFGNTDLIELPKSAIVGNWLEYPRKKTATKRRVPLWPETKAALKATAAASPSDFPFVFANERGRKVSDHRLVSYMFSSLCKRAKVTGHTFYDLRRTFQTIAENHSGNYDIAAIKAIMGHVDNANDMSARYRQNISDERLQAVTASVRKWLGKLPKGGAK